MFRRRDKKADDPHALRRAEAAVYGCLTCIHNRLPGNPDIDGCELGHDWDDETGCPYWRWADED
jgi:hypothetical protein